jgi:hypothetical protein
VVEPEVEEHEVEVEDSVVEAVERVEHVVD